MCGYDDQLIVLAFEEYLERIIKVMKQKLEKYFQIQWGINILFRHTL